MAHKRHGKHLIYFKWRKYWRGLSIVRVWRNNKNEIMVIKSTKTTTTTTDEKPKKIEEDTGEGEREREKVLSTRRKRMNNNRNTFFIGKLPLLLCVCARVRMWPGIFWHSSLFLYLVFFLCPLFIWTYKNGDTYINAQIWIFLYWKWHLTNATKINVE